MLSCFYRKFVADTVHHDKEVQQLYNKFNDLAKDKVQNRLFAVIQIGNEQRKVTTEDIICKVDEFHPTIGDRIRFEKVFFFLPFDSKYFLKTRSYCFFKGSSRW